MRLTGYDTDVKRIGDDVQIKFHEVYPIGNPRQRVHLETMGINQALRLMHQIQNVIGPTQSSKGKKGQNL